MSRSPEYPRRSPFLAAIIPAAAALAVLVFTAVSVVRERRTVPPPDGGKTGLVTSLTENENQFVQACIYLWCAITAFVPFYGGYLTMQLDEMNLEVGLLVFAVYFVPSLGVLLAAYGVLERRGILPFLLAKTATEQERQLKQVRSLAGVQGGVGLAIIATIGVFEMDELAAQMLFTGIVWAALASVYFVAFWASARIESRSS